jgi:hypothetical protein
MTALAKPHRIVLAPIQLHASMRRAETLSIALDQRSMPAGLDERAGFSLAGWCRGKSRRQDLHQ